MPFFDGAGEGIYSAIIQMVSIVFFFDSGGDYEGTYYLSYPYGMSMSFFDVMRKQAVIFNRYIWLFSS